MRVNKRIKETLREITTEAIKYHNENDKQRKYIRRILGLFKETLTEEEQIYIVKIILTELSYKSLVTDKDTLLTIYNLKNRTIFFSFLLFFITLISVIYFIDASPVLSGFVEHFKEILDFIF